MGFDDFDTKPVVEALDTLLLLFSWNCSPFELHRKARARRRVGLDGDASGGNRLVRVGAPSKHGEVYAVVEAEGEPIAVA